MLIYRDNRTRADPRQLLSGVRASLEPGSPPSHSEAVDALIALGAAESAIADAIFPERDGVDRITTTLREASGALGHVVWHTWRNQPGEAVQWVERCRARLAILELQELPEAVETSVPEGYAYYALYPETYLAAATECRPALRDRSAVCLGLRSIGTSLAAVVTGALEELGCRVTSYTLRPRGDPFDRRLALTPGLQAALLSARECCFLVIDEGPGISGSSLGGTAELLQGMGIPDQRIFLLPSWRTEGASLRSATARQHWSRHPQFLASFEEVWLDSGRFTERCPSGLLRDVSAGRWRSGLWNAPGSAPPIHPQHERRKYLLCPNESSDFAGKLWLSFAGLGGQAEARLRRGAELAEAGFTPAPEGVVHGFLMRRFVPGTAALPGCSDSTLLDTMARYLAHLCHEYPAEPSIGPAAIQQMVEVNVSEGLGVDWLPLLEKRLPREEAGQCERPVALDGRMFPHEWIRTGAGWIKTDALDHHEDHFFPGSHDIAWDIAMACVEFGLEPQERSWLVARYRALTLDRTIFERLPGQLLTYLAFRLGYATLAAQTLGGTPDGRRFARAARRYRHLLGTELDGTEAHSRE